MPNTLGRTRNHTPRRIMTTTTRITSRRESSGLHDAQRFEPVEIFAISRYLLIHSQNNVPR